MKKEYVKPTTVMRNVKLSCYINQVSATALRGTYNTGKRFENENGGVDMGYGIGVNNDIWDNDNLKDQL